MSDSSAKTRVYLDSYIVDSLLPDLIERGSATAFCIYVYLWHRTGAAARPTKVSYAKMADATNLSKSAVQAAVKLLTKRRFLRASRDTPTAMPEYTVLKPWLRD